jgi:hypothetical protein
MLQFEWDENKNATNFQKHGISFEEAKEIFDGVVLPPLMSVSTTGKSEKSVSAPYKVSLSSL